jgi:hypothetical protein
VGREEIGVDRLTDGRVYCPMMLIASSAAPALSGWLHPSDPFVKSSILALFKFK